MIIKQALANAIEKLKSNNITEASLKARLLLAYVLEVPKEYLIIHNNDILEEKMKNQYEKNIEEIIQGKPLEHITHNKEFMKMNFYVDENVLIPRADTEILVEQVISYCSKQDKEYKILDLCTGSGAIGISIAKYIENSEVLATDISLKALEIANKNAITNNARNIVFKKSDLFENIIEKFDIIVSNPPYIKTNIIKSLDNEVQKEPYIALDGGIDGLWFYRQLANNAYKLLNENGMLFLEIGYDQKEDVVTLLEQTNKYEKIECVQDLGGNNRVIKALLTKK